LTSAASLVDASFSVTNVAASVLQAAVFKRAGVAHLALIDFSVAATASADVLAAF